MNYYISKADHWVFVSKMSKIAEIQKLKDVNLVEYVQLQSLHSRLFLNKQHKNTEYRKFWTQMIHYVQQQERRNVL